MKAEKISLIISSICKEQGIEYNSCNPHLVTLQEDAIKMGKIYRNLKETIGILLEIEDRHELKDLRNKIDTIVKELDKADHLIIQVAKQLKVEND